MDYVEEEEIEIPNYFICPISLEIMKDPVTTVTGITYDRQSIVKWLQKVPSCPLTKQPLPLDSDLTPNHMLRRLIQHWCVENATRGVVRICTPRGEPNVVEEIKNLKKFGQETNDALKREDTLKKLEVLAMEGNNRRMMYEGGVHRSLILFIVKSTCEEEDGQRRIQGLDESLRLLHLIGVPLHDAKTILIENYRIMESLTWILHQQDFFNKAYTIVLLRNLTENTSSHIVERLNPEVFKGIIGFLKDVVNSLNRMSPSLIPTVQSSNANACLGKMEPSNLDHSLVIKQAVTAALMILLETSSWSRNRAILVDLGAVSGLIELEINSTGGKRITELVLGVLSRLCCCANGRAEILAHKGGIAVVTKRLLRVSPTADDRALSILNTVSKFSPENMVVEEMVNVGTVEKLCCVLRVGCDLSLKEKAKEILKDHFDEWKKFPCIDVTLLTKLLSSPPKDPLTEFHSRVGV